MIFFIKHTDSNQGFKPNREELKRHVSESNSTPLRKPVCHCFSLLKAQRAESSGPTLTVDKLGSLLSNENTTTLIFRSYHENILINTMSHS